MKNLYLYPKLDKSKLVSPNPYIDNLEIALCEGYNIVNKRPNNIGVLEFYFYLFKTDIYVFNWIEDIPTKKIGNIQGLFLIVLINIIKLTGKKIIWVLHNKYSHKSQGKKMVKTIFEFMIKKSDLILTHSSEGISFVSQKFPECTAKVNYIIHPIKKKYHSNTSAQKKYDILIWGTVYPYKGIVEFLEYVNSDRQAKDLKILIAGKCIDDSIHENLKKQLSSNIQHINSYLSVNELIKLTEASKYVLFTYNSDTVLSSGSLMDSIAFGGHIIGPHKGAFKDLSRESFLHTFLKYEEIPLLVENFETNAKQNAEALEKFCNENSWDAFYSKVEKPINELFKKRR